MSITHYSSNFYDTDLEAIRERVLAMGRLVEEQYRNAVNFIRTCDAAQATRVIETDEHVELQERAIDQLCCDLLIGQRVNQDGLRMATAAINIISDLRHIGDEASTIARKTNDLFNSGTAPEIDLFKTVRVIADRIDQILSEALNAFARLDVESASNLVGPDPVINHEFQSITRNAIIFMLEDRRTISAAIEALSLTKAIERIGEHVKSIAGWVLYAFEGKINSSASTV